MQDAWQQRKLPHCASAMRTLHLAITGLEAVNEEETMTWATPTLTEICIGLEINGYLPAEF